MEEDNTFEVLEANPLQASKVTPVKKIDGFSRMDVVKAFAQAFDMIGGVPRLALWANRNPDKFFPLYAKMLPSTSININTDGDKLVIEHAFPKTALDEHPTVVDV